jgi:hypothetical protein
MEPHTVMTKPDHVPTSAEPTTCVCAQPVPETRALRKGAARTYCVRCGLPTTISFERR